MRESKYKSTTFSMRSWITFVCIGPKPSKTLIRLSVCIIFLPYTVAIAFSSIIGIKHRRRSAESSIKFSNSVRKLRACVHVALIT